MEIISKSSLCEIIRIVQKKSKFQKVMLLYDNNVDSIKINEIHDLIKEFCVYNQMNINELNKEEIFDGYRLIIYLCTTDSFLKNQFDKSEFINVFCPIDNIVLPYFLLGDTEQNYLFVDNHIDLKMVSSVNFNIFYNYFKNLLNGSGISYLDDFYNITISQNSMIKFLQELDKDFEFLDLHIIQCCKLNYEDVMILDLLLIDCFHILINAIKHQNYMIVDVYKIAKENSDMIDKFYKLFYDESFASLIVLNYNCLNKFCLKTKSKIMEIINFFDIDFKRVEHLINILKEYSKNSDDIMAYVYMYDILNV